MEDRGGEGRRGVRVRTGWLEMEGKGNEGREAGNELPATVEAERRERNGKAGRRDGRGERDFPGQCQTASVRL